MEENRFDDIIRQKIEDWTEPFDAADALDFNQKLDDTAFDTLIQQKLNAYETPLQDFDWKFLSQHLNQHDFDRNIQSSLENLAYEATSSDWEDFAQNQDSISFDTLFREKIGGHPSTEKPDWNAFEQEMYEHQFDSEIAHTLADYEESYVPKDWMILDKALQEQGFDASVREKLATHQTPYQASDWLALKRILDGKRIKYERVLLLLLLLLVGGGGFYWLNNSLKSPNSVQTNVTQKGESHSQNANPTPAVTSKSFDDSTYSQTEERKIMEQNENAAVSPIKKAKNEPINSIKYAPISKPLASSKKETLNQSFSTSETKHTKEQLITAANIAISSPSTSVVNDNLPIISKTNDNKTTTQIGLTEISKTNDNKTTTQIVLTETNPSKKEDAPIAIVNPIVEKQATNYSDKKAIAISPLALQTTKLIPSLSTDLSPSIKQKDKFHSRFSVGIYSAILGSTVEWNQAMQKGYSAGLRSEWEFAKHWTLVTDVLQSSRTFYYNYYKRISQKTIRYLWVGEVRSIDIPIAIRKSWSINSHFEAYIQAGIAPSRSLGETYKDYDPFQLSSLDSISNKTLLGTIPVKNEMEKHWYRQNIQTAIGLKANWHNFSATIEPRYQYWNSPLQRDEKKLHTLSLGMSVLYRFGGKK